jgi:hypothetical protein
MKTFKLIAASLIMIGVNVCGAQNNTLQNAINTVSGAVSNGGTPSNDDIAKGLKEALKVGTNNSVASSSKVDGFYKNPEIKIPYPAEAKEMEQYLRDAGMGAQCDKFVETLNHGAEGAVKSAAPIFIDAITKLTIADGMKILKGPNDAATQYLKQNTSTQLKSAFLPIVRTALDKVEITKYWTPLVNVYDKVPFVTKVNPDLNSYVTGKAIEGLFKLIADEELKIRTNPAARISDILKEVFGL